MVPFRERPELDELLSWCNSKTNVKVRLVTGKGGTGKTRLALQLWKRLEATGWQPLWVRRGDEGRAADLVEKFKKRPVLLVVDYAETRNGLGEMLLDVAGDPDGSDRRVVLLARGTGEWWERLINCDKRLGDILAAPPIWLGPTFVADKQDEVFQEAVAAFAKALGVERPNITLALADPEPVVLDCMPRHFWRFCVMPGKMMAILLGPAMT